jgi:hypothetical protein
MPKLNSSTLVDPTAPTVVTDVSFDDVCLTRRGMGEASEGVVEHPATDAARIRRLEHTLADRIAEVDYLWRVIARLAQPDE